MQTNNPRLKVGVLFGGRSAEHEVSILSARNVLAALDPELFEPVPIAITREGRWLLQSPERLLREKGDPRAANIDPGGMHVTLFERPTNGRLATAQSSDTALRVDVIVPVLHGPMGEDGTMQGLLELSGIPYVGAGVLGSAVGMDKDVMKRLLHQAGIPIAPFVTIRQHDFARAPQSALLAAERLRYPLFVKPANLGSSVGITKVVTRAQLPGALDLAFTYDTKAIVEQALGSAGQEPEYSERRSAGGDAGQEPEYSERRSAGGDAGQEPEYSGRRSAREIECAVLGNDDPVVSIPGEVIVNHVDGFYSYDAKYIDDGAVLSIPAALTAQQVREVQRLAVTTFRTLECSGLARVDFFLQPNGQWFVNEINTLPGFTAISMFPKLWAASGVQPRELITRLIDLAFARNATRRALRSVPSVRHT